MGERITERKEWQGYIKNANQEIETVDLTSTTYAPEVEKFDWVRQAPPIRITPTRATRKHRKDVLVVDLPDIQYGWRKQPDGALVPLHDPEAMDTALQITKELQPDHIVLGGDDMDFGEFSRFAPDSRHFTETTQLAIDGLFKFYAQLRAENPNAQVHALEGNHNRLTKFVLKNAMQLHGLKRAGSLEDYPVLTYPFLMRFDDLDFNWYSGYPANSVRIENTQYIHGNKVKSKGSTAPIYAQDNEINTVYHHVHRHEMHTRTNKLGKFITASTFGCLADITGSVPSYGNGVDDRGQVVRQYENWANGIGIIQEYGEYTQMRPVHIRSGVAQVDGLEYTGAAKW